MFPLAPPRVPGHRTWRPLAADELNPGPDSDTVTGWLAVTDQMAWGALGTVVSQLPAMVMVLIR